MLTVFIIFSFKLKTMFTSYNKIKLNHNEHNDIKKRRQKRNIRGLLILDHNTYCYIQSTHYEVILPYPLEGLNKIKYYLLCLSRHREYSLTPKKLISTKALVTAEANESLQKAWGGDSRSYCLLLDLFGHILYSCRSILFLQKIW